MTCCPERMPQANPSASTRCYVVDLGMAGGLARDQDEPPIAFNLGDNSSQRAYVDCDPDWPNLKSEIAMGCQWPPYAANKFDTTPYCPGHRRVLRQGRTRRWRVAALPLRADPDR